MDNIITHHRPQNWQHEYWETPRVHTTYGASVSGGFSVKSADEAIADMWRKICLVDGAIQPAGCFTVVDATD